MNISIKISFRISVCFQSCLKSVSRNNLGSNITHQVYTVSDTFCTLRHNSHLKYCMQSDCWLYRQYCCLDNWRNYFFVMHWRLCVRFTLVTYHNWPIYGWLLGDPKNWNVCWHWSAVLWLISPCCEVTAHCL